MRIVRAFIVAVAMLLALAPSAFAFGAPVVIGPEHEEGEGFIFDCGDFDIVDHYSLDFTVRLFFDADGNLYRGVESVQGTDRFVNSETGTSISGHFANTVLIDFESGLGANSGIVFKIILPGTGPVFMEIGHVISNRDGSIVTFQAGPRDFSDGNFEAVCEALGG
jgi:hypothetical protein